MSLNTHTSISIGGQEFRQFHRLRLEQSTSGHHQFEILISYDWLHRIGKGIFTASKEFLGKEASIVIKPVEAIGEARELTFNGIITAVNAGKEGDGTHGFCVLRGCSPTIALDTDPHIQHFEQQTLSEIVQQVIKNGEPFIGKSNVEPRFSDTLKYTVQYRESHYAFLCRLAARYGEWFFYDGQRTCFGGYSPRKITLTHQTDLVDFDLQLQVLPNNMQYQSYEYRQDMRVMAATNGAGKSNAYTEHAANMSKRLYPKPTLNKSTQALNSSAKAQLEQLTTLHQKGRQAQLVTLTGNSTNPGIRPGDTVSIQESFYSSEAHGEFTVTHITHHCTGNGEYTNHFTGIPAESAMPPVELDQHPHCEPQSAVVTDNNDPKGLGRVQVRFRWQQQGNSPWIRLIAPHGGGSKGFYFIPEIGEEVWTDFEGGNPDLPFVLGTTYNGHERTKFGDAQNNIKTIRTRSGHTIRMDDTAGGEQIVISDRNGNIITLDTHGRHIYISAPENLILTAKNIRLDATENVTVGAGESISANARTNVSIAARKNMQVNAGEDYHLSATNISEQASDNFSRQAKTVEEMAQKVSIDSSRENMELRSGKKVDVQSVEKVQLF